jgi:hypothetical protein
MPKSNLYAKANRHIALQVWFGTLESYFPLHVSSELQYLRQEWGNPACLFRGCLIGYDPEEEPKTYDPGPPKKLEFNTHGSCGNTMVVGLPATGRNQGLFRRRRRSLLQLAWKIYQGERAFPDTPPCTNHTVYI